ncbi:MAG TPA: hypothetical protein VK567_00725 [Bradyrhizobium sp.]|nr:hypothetical protein [Bradyrhizobium sp.]
MVQSMLSLENVNDAQENRLSCDFGAIARYPPQSPAQFARDRSALMLGQSLAEWQRFAAMTQHQTRPD